MRRCLAGTCRNRPHVSRHRWSDCARLVAVGHWVAPQKPSREHRGTPEVPDISSTRQTRSAEVSRKGSGRASPGNDHVESRCCRIEATHPDRTPTCLRLSEPLDDDLTESLPDHSSLSRTRYRYGLDISTPSSMASSSRASLPGRSGARRSTPTPSRLRPI
jgi:hypothetical protein